VRTGTGHRLPSSRPRPGLAAGSAAQHGLTTAGVVVVLCVVTGVALVVDLVVATGLSWLFTVGFVLGCAYVAARVRRTDDLSALVAPPLVFAAAMLVADAVVGSSSPGQFPISQVLDLATSLAVGAPVLMTGCAVAAAVVLVRRWRGPRP
jgi:hypothetical protein